MAVSLLLALLASQVEESSIDEFLRPRRVDRVPRASGRSGPGIAFFEAFPVSGAGTRGACSTTAPTGAKGEALTFTRTGSATCTKTTSGGLATTGIADGDLVTVAGNVARVEYDSQGVLGLLVESSRQNVLLQSGDIFNAAYTDVATPTLTGSQTDPFNTSTAVQVSDNDPAALEGRQQTVTVTLAAASVMSCYVKAGTSALARLTLDGTVCNVSGLSSSTWTRAVCVDASASAASVVAQMLVGNASGDQGTVIYGGCQVEVGPYATSYIPTTTAAVTRNAEQADLAVPSLTVSAPFSLAATVSLPDGVPTNARLHGTLGPTSLATFVADSYASGGAWTVESTQVSPISYITGRTVAANGTYRASTYHDGTNFNGCIDGTCGAGVARAWTNLGSVVLYRVGAYTSSNGVIDGIQSRVCFQNDSATRCR